MEQNTVGIGQTSQETGVSERMLRHWQSVGYINPEIVVCGDRNYRRYTSQDIQLIKTIKELKDEGFTLNAAVKQAKIKMEKRND